MPLPRQTGGKMQLAERIWRAYETLPYPAWAEEEPLQHPSRTVPVDWIYAIAQPTALVPKRILVAGCGTGAEAFSLRRQFPRATIVGIDFSERSLAIARRRQRELPPAKSIRFIAADLTRRNLNKQIGEQFDFICCHGVLSYVPDAGAALRNLAKCLDQDGVLYLGVNGVRHFSASWQPALRALGCETSWFEDQRAVREALKICDALADRPIGWMANENAEYLGSDLFAPMIANRPLHRWNALCRLGGLHFVGSHSAQRNLRRLITSDLLDQLRPRTRPELHELAELIRPSEFHRLVFARKAPPKAPWDDGAVLQQWRVYPALSSSSRSRSRRGSPLAFRRFTLKSVPTNTVIDLRAPQWVLWILRESDGAQTVAEIVGGASAQISNRSLCKHLYLLYGLALINLQPPLDT